MSVWYAVPSKRPWAESTLPQWKERGYKIAVYVDSNYLRDTGFVVDICVRSESLVDPGHPVALPYPGYAKAVNYLVDWVLKLDPDCDWIVTGGDDVLPDPNHTPEEIAFQCSEHFAPGEYKVPGASTFGVMQPTGDRYGESPTNRDPAMRSAYADRVCGSPWMGREFCKRINQGNGPLWPEYFHMGVDHELQCVAEKLGILWQRPDLTHFHEHWARPRANAADMPEFLKRANSPEEWQAYLKIFNARKAAGFPGSDPL